MLQLKDKQQKIYDGLSAIGGEIASFYIDGVRLINDEHYSSKAYLIAHIAREIDGGIRDLLSEGVTKECEACKRPMHGQIDDPQLEGIESNHLKSILSSLGIINKKNEFAIFWKKTATNFSKFAHRSGAYREPRDSSNIITMWYDYEVVLYKLIGEYITQIEIIDRIIKKEPDDKIIHTVKNLIRDENRYRHFFNNLKNPAWLPFLFKYDFFCPDSVPSSLENRYWSPISYLDFVSEEIKAGKSNIILSQIIVDIIYTLIESDSYSRYSNDSRLWYYLLKLLSKLSKKFIPENFITILPKFFNHSDSSKLTGQGLIDLLNSYFEEDDLSQQNKDIIESLAVYVFSLSTDTKFYDKSEEDENIYPKVPSYLLKDLSKSEDFIDRIVNNCSNDFILGIFDELENYLDKGYVSGIFRNSIFFDSNRSHNDHSIEIIYSDFCKGIFKRLASNDALRLKQIVDLLYTDRYSHAYTKKLIYYGIAQNYRILEDCFTNLLTQQDIFSDVDNHNDLYFLMEIIATELNESKSLRIKEIVDKGSQNDYFYNDDIDYFRIYWYSALKENKFFVKEFKELSQKLNRTYDSLKPKKQIFVTSGSKSPYSLTELRKFSARDLVVTLKDFDPVRGFDTPDSEGLANVVESYISECPEAFCDNYLDFIDLQFIYTTKIFYGLNNAIQADNKKIDWENILKFILQYSSQDKFKDDSLKLKNNRWGYDKYAFIHAACRLLTKANGKASLSYGIEYVPLAGKIFELYLQCINYNVEEGEVKIGSASYLVNSSNGIILEAFLMHILRKARDIDTNQDNKISRWSDHDREIFDKLYQSDCREFFMLLGMFKLQLLFIDYTWTIDKISTMPLKDMRQIKSFFGTHIFSGDPSLPDYENLNEIYRTAIVEDWKLDEFATSNSVERHISIFYLFGYEKFERDSLMTLLLNTKDIQRIGKIIHFFAHYVKGYIDTLPNEEKIVHQKRIMILWKEIFKIIQELKAEDANSEISGLVDFIQYVEEINEENFILIKETARLSAKHWEVDKLLEYLIVLKDLGNSSRVANYIFEILNEVIFHDIYFITHLEKDLVILIEHFYKCNDLTLKDKADNLCNELVKKGFYFAKSAYLSNN